MQKFKRGRLLTAGQVRALPDNSVVWIIYRESDERINCAQQIVRMEEYPDRWNFLFGNMDLEGILDNEKIKGIEQCGEGALSCYEALPVE